MSRTKNSKPKIPSCDVHLLHEHHPSIRAEDWRSPLVRRLINSDVYADGDCPFENSFREETSIIKENEILLLWTGLKEDFDKCVRTYQSPHITEYATLGLACILLTQNASMEITEVTRRGERADYWIGDKDLLVEISGQQYGNLADLCAEKAKQLLENPFNKSGYVCVAIYSDCQARLWFFSKNGFRA